MFTGPFVGYYNPLLAYGEEKAIQDAFEAGANGFIMVDLPPEEAVGFREKCTKAKLVLFSSLHPIRYVDELYSLSYVPLIAPSTTLPRIKFLASIADSFIYIVSKVRTLSLLVESVPDRVLQMGVTGSSDKIAMNKSLPEIVSRVREYATVPIAVGFGVATRDHFNVVVDAGADGVVVGSRLVSVMRDSPRGEVAKKVEAYCLELCQKGQPARLRSPPAASSIPPNINMSHPEPQVTTDHGGVLPARFGQFGGQYAPESLVAGLVELEEAHKSAMEDPEFLKEFQSYYGYMNRPSKFYLAENLTQDAGGANIWLKREDL